MATSVASIAVNLIARTSGFNRDMKGAAITITALGTAVRSTASRLAGFTSSLLGVTGIFSGGLLLKNSLKDIDTIGKVADKLGIATERMAGLHLAARLADVETTALNKALQMMVINVDKASDGTGEGADALKRLGLNAASLKLMPVASQLDAIADALQAVGSQSDKLAISAAIFGAKGTGLLTMLKDGAAGLAKVQQVAERLRLTFTHEQFQRVERFNDAVTTLKDSFTGLANVIAIKISPWMTKLAGAFTVLVVKFHDMNASTAKAVLAWGAWAIKVGAVLALTPQIVKALGVVAKAIKSLAAAETILQGVSGVGLLKIAAGASAAAGVWLGLEKLFSKIDEEFESLAKEAGKFSTEVGKGNDELNDLLDTMKQIDAVNKSHFIEFDRSRLPFGPLNGSPSFPAGRGRSPTSQPSATSQPAVVQAVEKAALALAKWSDMGTGHSPLERFAARQNSEFYNVKPGYWEGLGARAGTAGNRSFPSQGEENKRTFMGMLEALKDVGRTLKQLPRAIKEELSVQP